MAYGRWRHRIVLAVRLGFQQPGPELRLGAALGRLLGAGLHGTQPDRGRQR